MQPDTTDPREEKGPGYVAIVAVCIARDDNPSVRAKMDDYLAASPFEIKADTIDDLAVKVSRYTMDAVVSIQDPGADNIAIAMMPKRG